MQGPAGVRTDYPPLENENNGMETLEPGGVEMHEGIVGPEGVACKVLRTEVDLPWQCYSMRVEGSQDFWLCSSSSRQHVAATHVKPITSAETHVAINK